MMSECHSWHLCCLWEYIVRSKTQCSWSLLITLSSRLRSHDSSACVTPFGGNKFEHTATLCINSVWISSDPSVHWAAIYNQLWLTWFVILIMWCCLNFVPYLSFFPTTNTKNTLLFMSANFPMDVALHQPLCAATTLATAPRSRFTCACSSVHVEPNCQEEGTRRERNLSGWIRLYRLCRICRTKFSSEATRSPLVAPGLIIQILICHSWTSADTRCLNTPRLSGRVTAGWGDEKV